MFDWLTQEVSQSAITYPVIALACATDVLIPQGRRPGRRPPLPRREGTGPVELGGAGAAPPRAILIGVGRFIPGGRTATTFAAGTLEMPYRQFLVADAFAAVIWAVYISMLGYLGGETFKDSLWLPLATSFAGAMAVGLGFEVWRRLQRRGGKDILGDELPDEVAT